MFKRGDIIIIPIPFTDLSSQKRRPVIVISDDTYNSKTSDLIVIAMTSITASSDYSITITSTDLEYGQLNRPSKVRADKIYTLSQSIVCKNFGRVKNDVLKQIGQILEKLIRINNFTF